MLFPYILADEEGIGIGGLDVPGFAVITQSCDIIKSDRPMLQIAALQALPPEHLDQVERRRRPQFGHIPALKEIGYAVDFDHVTLVSKEVVAGLQRSPGCTNDDEKRAFAQALARHKRRTAYPIRFNDAVEPMKKWLDNKKGKASAAGRFADEIDQIRVACSDWDAGAEISFTCILSNEPPIAELTEWLGFADKIISKVVSEYPGTTIRLVTWDQFSARELRDSDQLDFDGLSQPSVAAWAA